MPLCGRRLPSATPFHSLTHLCLSIWSLFLLPAFLSHVTGSASAPAPPHTHTPRAGLPSYFIGVPGPWDAPPAQPLLTFLFEGLPPSLDSRGLSPNHAVQPKSERCRDLNRSAGRGGRALREPQQGKGNCCADQKWPSRWEMGCNPTMRDSSP